MRFVRFMCALNACFGIFHTALGAIHWRDDKYFLAIGYVLVSIFSFYAAIKMWELLSDDRT
jgi:hypothetical protein